MNESQGPPRLLERIGGALLPPADRADALGDLHEEYRIIASRSGRAAANRWYRAQLLRAVGPMLGRWMRAARSLAGGGNLKLALRSLRRAPGRSAVLAGVLVLGIGSSAAIFSVVDQVLLRPLPYERPEELHSVWNVYPAWEGDPVLDAFWRQVTLSWLEYLDVREGSETVREVAAYGFSEAILQEPGDPTLLWVGHASANLFSMLGVRPRLGRVFTQGEEGRDAPAIALVTHGFWLERLGGDPSPVGSTVRIEGRPFEVVGVLPRSFRLRGQSPFGSIPVQELWVPIGALRDTGNRGDRSFEVIARMEGDLPLEVAGAELTRLVWGDDPDAGRRVRVTPRHPEETGSARAPLMLLLGSALVMLVIVVANVTTLRIGSVAGREREWATRVALGARRRHLRGQLLTESLLFGAIGLVGGGLLAVVAIDILVGLTPPELLLGVDVALDIHAFLFASAAALVVSVASGWLPLLRVRDRSASAVIGHRELSPGRRAGLFQRSLLVSQVALSVVLLSGTALFLRSLQRMTAVDPGFRTEGIVTLDVTPPAGRFASTEELLAFHERLARRIEAIPGVTGVGATSIAPFGEGVGSNSFQIESRPTPEGAKSPEGLRRSVRPGFFELLGIPVLEGRPLRATDGTDDPPVAVVSASMAEAYWPGRSPLGDAIVRNNGRFEIVGVVGDVRRRKLTADPEPTYYTPLAQEPLSAMDLLIRLETVPGNVAQSIRDAVWAEDPDIPLPALETLTERVRRSLRTDRFRTWTTAFFGAAAALLVALGMFGVAVQTAVRRTREIGVRIALGATPTGVTGMMVRRELRVVWLGLGIGLVIVWVAGRALSGLLFDVRPTDPRALLAAATSLVVVALAAVWMPVRRAARLDPSDVLTEE